MWFQLRHADYYTNDDNAADNHSNYSYLSCDDDTADDYTNDSDLCRRRFLPKCLFLVTDFLNAAGREQS